MSDDNILPGYAEKRDQRTSDDLDAQIRALASGSAPTPDQPVMEKKPEQKSWYQEVLPQMYYGGKKGIKNALEAIDDSANWLNDNVINLRTADQQAAYEQFKQTGVRGYEQSNQALPINIDTKSDPKATTFTGNLVHGASEFLVGFLPALRALRLVGVGAAVGSIAEGAAAGGIGAYFSLDPKEKRLSNMLNELAPELRNPVTDFLATDPNDSAALGRFKNALENTIVGAGADVAITGLLKGITAFKGYMVEKGLQAADVIKGAGDEAAARNAVMDELGNVIKQADELKTPAESMASPELSQPTVDYLKKIGAIKEDGAVDLQSIRNAQDNLMAKVTPDLDMPAPKAPEMEGIFGSAEDKPLFKTKITPKQVDNLVDQIMIGDPRAINTTKGIDFNFGKIDSPESIREVINATSEAFSKSTSEATRGKVTFEQIEKFASEIGTTAKNLEDLYGSTGDLAERFLAGRVLIQKSSQQLVDTANYAKSLLYNTAFDTPEQKEAAIQAALLAVRKQAMIHGDLQAQLKGSQTEIARALSAMRMTVKGDKFSSTELTTLLDHFGGQKLNSEFLDKIASMANNPEQLNKFTRGSWSVRTQDALQELWTNSILSSPVTHAANIVGNTLRAIGGVAETATAATVGLFRRGTPDMDRATFQEAIAQATGMMEGLREAIAINFKANQPALEGTMYKAFNGTVDITRSTFDNPNAFDPKFTAKNLAGKYADGNLGRFVDFVGEAIRLPGKLLSTEDQLFYTINYRGSLKQNAYRTARKEGLEGDEFVKRMADLIENPPKDLMKKAHDDAIEGTFAKPLDADGGVLDRMGLWLQNAKNSGMNGKQLVPALHYIVPFVKTPTNIIKFAYDRFPALNLVSESNRAILSKGGREADQMLAQYATGGMFLALGSYLASQGMLTGGDTLHNKSTREIGGVQPYSIKVGDTYYAYNRLEPFGMFLGLAADFATMAGHLDDYKKSELAYAAASAVAKNLASKTYLQGIVDFIGATDDLMKGQTAGAEKFMKNFVTGFVPYKGLLGAVNRTSIDPVMHETWGLFDSVKASIPGLSNTLPPHRNLLTGDPVVYQGGLGADIASPIYQTKEAVDPSAKEIARLNMNLEHPSKRIGNVDLTPNQYDRLMVLLTKEVKSGGKTLVENLNERVSSPNWSNKSERQVEDNAAYLGSKEFEIKKIFGGYKQAAVQRLISEDPVLAKAVMSDKRNKGNALLGRSLEAIDNQ